MKPSISMEMECITQIKEVPNIIQSGEREKLFLKIKTLYVPIKKHFFFRDEDLISTDESFLWFFSPT